MTSLISKEVICPNCGTEGNITLYSSINVTLNPELQKKMDNGQWRIIYLEMPQL